MVLNQPSAPVRGAETRQFWDRALLQATLCIDPGEWDPTNWNPFWDCNIVVPPSAANSSTISLKLKPTGGVSATNQP